MRLGLLAPDVMQVVGGHERQIHLRREAQQLLVQAALLGQAVVLELEEEVALAQDVAVRAGNAPGLVHVAGFERARDLATQARRQPDQPLRVLGQEITVDARLVVVAVEVRAGDEAAQVLVAGPVARQQDEVIRLVVGLAFAVGHRAPRDVGLDADDGLDARRATGLVEGHRPVQRAVIRYGQRVEAERLGLRHQLRDAAQAVEQAELGVDVEMREIVRRDGQQSSPGLAYRR